MNHGEHSLKTTIAALAILALIPVAAPAKSAYAACLEAQQMLGGSSPSRYIPVRSDFARAMDNTHSVQNNQYATNYVLYSPFSFRLSSDTSWGEYNRVSKYVRACRHLKTSKPRANR
jgi:hypothetical protein